MYLTEIPVLFVFLLCIQHNDLVEGKLKLYPLMIALIAATVYMFIYLYRAILISYDCVKTVGPYSSKEKALIKKGKTLTLTLLSRGRIRVELFGTNEAPPTLDWAKNEDYENVEINLFREKAVGGKGAIRRVLKYFEVPNEDVEKALASELFEKSYQNIDLRAETKNELREIRIKFTKTV